MVSLLELDRVVKYLINHGVKLCILYCVSKYPCPKEEFNLSTIEYLKDRYSEVVIGFSDHSIGSEASLAAVKLGARVIEKHFSLDRNLWGSDHKVSMNPKEMKAMVKSIRAKTFESLDYSLFYGYKEKELEGANNIYRPYFEKKLVAGQDISQGTVITEQMLYSMRPAKEISGFSSNRLSEIIGKTTAKEIDKYQPITLDCIE